MVVSDRTGDVYRAYRFARSVGSPCNGSGKRLSIRGPAIAAPRSDATKGLGKSLQVEDKLNSKYVLSADYMFHRRCLHSIAVYTLT